VVLRAGTVLAALGAVVVVVVVDGPARSTEKCSEKLEVELRATRAKVTTRLALEGFGPMTTLAVKDEEHGRLLPL
jgi:hypothetical protein